MHMIRGTGLRGLGGIAPVRGRLIRPMLEITREEILRFLEEYHLSYVTDSSNASDRFLRNRVRHNVVPLLSSENPNFAVNLSLMALRLREDEKVLCELASPTEDVKILRSMPDALRSRALDRYLKDRGVPEPEAEHIALVSRLVFSDHPSAEVMLPGGVTVRRNYDRLSTEALPRPLEKLELSCPGELVIPQAGVRIVCRPANEPVDRVDCFTVRTEGTITVRCRETADRIRLSGGTKSLKKLFIDRKIPAAERGVIPVLEDDLGILGVYRIGPDRGRIANFLPAVEICFIPLDTQLEDGK